MDAGSLYIKHGDGFHIFFTLVADTPRFFGSIKNIELTFLINKVQRF